MMVIINSKSRGAWVPGIARHSSQSDPDLPAGSRPSTLSAGAVMSAKSVRAANASAVVASTFGLTTTSASADTPGLRYSAEPRHHARPMWSVHGRNIVVTAIDSARPGPIQLLTAVCC